MDKLSFDDSEDLEKSRRENQQTFSLGPELHHPEASTLQSLYDSVVGYVRAGSVLTCC